MPAAPGGPFRLLKRPVWTAGRPLFHTCVKNDAENNRIYVKRGCRPHSRGAMHVRNRVETFPSSGRLLRLGSPTSLTGRRASQEERAFPGKLSESQRNGKIAPERPNAPSYAQPAHLLFALFFKNLLTKALALGCARFTKLSGNMPHPRSEFGSP